MNRRKNKQGINEWEAIDKLGQALSGNTPPVFNDTALDKLDEIRGACWECLDVLGSFLGDDELTKAAGVLTRLARGRAGVDDRHGKDEIRIKKDAVPHIHVPRPVLFIHPDAVARSIDILSIRVGDLVAIQTSPNAMIVLGVVAAIGFHGLEGISQSTYTAITSSHSSPFRLMDKVAHATCLEDLTNETLARIGKTDREKLEKTLVFRVDELDYSPDPSSIGDDSNSASSKPKRGRRGRPPKNPGKESETQQKQQQQENISLPALAPASLLVGASLTGTSHICRKGQVMPILDPVVTGAIINLRPGDTCFAIWPDTTVFYQATVLDSAQRQGLSTGTKEALSQPVMDDMGYQNQGARIGSEWHTLVKFEGDSADEAYSRYVYSSFVLPSPSLWP